GAGGRCGGLPGSGGIWSEGRLGDNGRRARPPYGLEEKADDRRTVVDTLARTSICENSYMAGASFARNRSRGIAVFSYSPSRSDRRFASQPRWYRGRGDLGMAPGPIEPRRESDCVQSWVEERDAPFLQTPSNDLPIL